MDFKTFLRFSKETRTKHGTVPYVIKDYGNWIFKRKFEKYLPIFTTKMPDLDPVQLFRIPNQNVPDPNGRGKTSMSKTSLNTSGSFIFRKEHK